MLASLTLRFWNITLEIWKKYAGFVEVMFLQNKNCNIVAVQNFSSYSGLVAS
jgi:hypothetical protein